MRLNVYSILLKDPEGFNDDEGALVYIRYEASEITESSSLDFNINPTEVNKELYSLYV